MTHTLTVSRPRARGLDLLVMRISIAMLRWARRRADRSALTHEQHAQRLRAHAELAARAHADALRAARVR